MVDIEYVIALILFIAFFVLFAFKMGVCAGYSIARKEWGKIAQVGDKEFSEKYKHL